MLAFGCVCVACMYMYKIYIFGIFGLAHVCVFAWMFTNYYIFSNRLLPRINTCIVWMPDVTLGLVLIIPGSQNKHQAPIEAETFFQMLVYQYIAHGTCRYL